MQKASLVLRVSVALAGLINLASNAVWAQEAAAPAAAAAEGAAGGGGGGDLNEVSHSGLYGIIFGGGLFHTIVWFALFGASLATVALLVDGCLTIRRDKLLPADLISGVRESLNAGDLDAATSTCELNPGQLSRILMVGFSNIEEGFEVIQESVASSAEFEAEKLLQRVSYLNVAGQIGPMLGLIGTVMGMVSAFAGLGSTGSARAAGLALGISTSLYCTVTGLAIAIPALLGYALFKNKTTRIILEMQSTVIDLIKVLRTAEVEQK